MYLVRFKLAGIRGYAGEDCVTQDFYSATRFHDPIEAEKEIERWWAHSRVYKGEVVTEEEEIEELGIGNEQ